MSWLPNCTLLERRPTEQDTLELTDGILHAPVRLGKLPNNDKNMINIFGELIQATNQLAQYVIHLLMLVLKALARLENERLAVRWPFRMDLFHDGGQHQITLALLIAQFIELAFGRRDGEANIVN